MLFKYRTIFEGIKDKMTVSENESFAGTQCFPFQRKEEDVQSKEEDKEECNVEDKKEDIKKIKNKIILCCTSLHLHT